MKTSVRLSACLSRQSVHVLETLSLRVRCYHYFACLLHLSSEPMYDWKPLLWFRVCGDEVGPQLGCGDVLASKLKHGSHEVLFVQLN